MSLFIPFQNYYKKHLLFQKEDHLLLAVSGGIDSVVLADLCKKSGFDFSIAHANFRLRGDESLDDEAFVIELGAQLGVPTIVKRFDTEKYASEKKLSIQEAARNLRYDWFKSIMEEKTQHENVLVTAHHAGDNAETVLMNLFKGTGMQGLTGIRRKHGYIRRPLLFATRKQIEVYATEHNLKWREDTSNLKTDYTRNFVRLNIIPEIEKITPSFQTNMLHNIERFESILNLYQFSAEKILKKLVVQKENEIHIPIQGLLKKTSPGTLLYEVLYPLGFSPAQCDAVLQILNSKTGKYVETEKHRALINRKWLIISPITSISSHHILINEAVTKIEAEDFNLVIEQIAFPEKLDLGFQTVLLDVAKIEFPLLLRKVKPGDYFYPLGMNKKKKLTRFFTDIKLPLHKKENVWVLTSSERVVWVVGYRLDNRFKISETTKCVMKVQLFSKNGRL